MLISYQIDERGPLILTKISDRKKLCSLMQSVAEEYGSLLERVSFGSGTSSTGSNWGYIDFFAQNYTFGVDSRLKKRRITDEETASYRRRHAVVWNGDGM